MSKLLTKKHFLGVAASTFVSVFLVTGFVFAAITFNANIQVGGGTPDLTLNGDDIYVNGTLEVNGEFDLDGARDADSTADFSATTTFSGGNGGSLQMNDNSRILIGSAAAGDLAIVHDGTNTTLTSATGDLIIDNTGTTSTRCSLLSRATTSRNACVACARTSVGASSRNVRT